MVTKNAVFMRSVAFRKRLYKNCEKEVRDLKRKQENLNQYLGRTTPPDAAQEQLEKKNTPNL